MNQLGFKFLLIFGCLLNGEAFSSDLGVEKTSFEHNLVEQSVCSNLGLGEPSFCHEIIAAIKNKIEDGKLIIAFDLDNCLVGKFTPYLNSQVSLSEYKINPEAFDSKKIRSQNLSFNSLFLQLFAAGAEDFAILTNNIEAAVKKYFTDQEKFKLLKFNIHGLCDRRQIALSNLNKKIPSIYKQPCGYKKQLLKNLLDQKLSANLEPSVAVYFDDRQENIFKIFTYKNITCFAFRLFNNSDQIIIDNIVKEIYLILYEQNLIRGRSLIRRKTGRKILCSYGRDYTCKSCNYNWHIEPRELREQGEPQKCLQCLSSNISGQDG